MDIPAAAKLAGLKAAFIGCAAFSFAATLIALIFLRDIGKVGERAKKPSPEGVIAEEEGELGVKSSAASDDGKTLVQDQSS